MVKEITLSIKEIADWKEKGIIPEKMRIVKTHDGTSSGPINAHIKDFIRECKNSAFRCVDVYTKDGELIKKEREGVENEIQREAPVYSKEDLEKMGTDNHIIYKPTGQDNESHVWTQLPYDNFDNRYSEDDEYLEVPNADDMERLTYTNEDGDSLVRSITMMTGGGGGNENKYNNTVTVIKNNQFTPENNEALMNAGQKLNDVVNEYEDKKWDIEKEVQLKWEKDNGIEDGWYIDEHGARRSSIYHPTYEKMRAEAYEKIQAELPDIYTYIDESGVYDDFENANAKLKIRKNSGIEPENKNRGGGNYPYNQDDYEDVWSERYGEMYSEPDEPDW